MRKTLAAAAAITALTAPASLLVAVAPANAYAGTPGCVTTLEYKSVHNGMTQRQVAKRFGTINHPYWGHVTFTWDSDFNKEVDREWRICNSAGKPKASWDGGVEVDFEKDADWDTGEFPPGPLLETHKLRWS